MITTCLWSHDNNALEMAEFYTSTFPNSKITIKGLYDAPNEHLPGSKKGDIMIVEFELIGVPFATLNGGPYFKIDPSISFFVNSSDKEEITRIWKKLSEGGKSLMDLASYPWSEWYGWVEDKYGATWQLFFTEESLTQRIAPCLAFAGGKLGNAEEAVNYYTSVFPDSGVNLLSRYGEGEAGEKGYINHSQFHIGDFIMAAMDAVGAHTFDFSCAVSFMIPCRDEKELEYYYEKLSAVPEAEMCGWVADKYGVSWQLIPENFTNYMKNGEEEKKSRLMKALMEMKKLSWDAIENAYNGK